MENFNRMFLPVPRQVQGYNLYRRGHFYLTGWSYGCLLSRCEFPELVCKRCCFHVNKPVF